MEKLKVVNEVDEIMLQRQTVFKSLEYDDEAVCTLERYGVAGLFKIKSHGDKKIVYSIPYAVPLATYIKNGLTIHKFYNIIVQAAEITKRVRINSLDSKHLMFSFDYTYVREISGDLYFLYEPVMEVENLVGLKEFLCEFVDKIDEVNPSMYDEVQKFRKFLCNWHHRDINALEDFIMERYPMIFQEIEIIKIERKTSSKAVNEKPLNQEANVRKRESQRLGSKKQRKAVLLRTRDNKEIAIDSDKFLIGKAEDNNLVISENKAVSRKHAAIIRKTDSYAIQDMNSTNGTCVNREKISAYVERRIQTGDLIEIADEKFEFQIKG